MKSTAFYTTEEAAEKIGCTYDTLLRWIREGKVPVDQFGRSYVFTDESIAAIRQIYSPPGMTHTDIGKAYGISREMVVYYFKERLHVKPIGTDCLRGGGAVYDPETVKKMADLIGWEHIDDT